MNFERNRYSVSVTAAGKPVQLRATATKVTLLQNEQMVDLLLAAHEQGVDAVEAACQTALDA